MRKPACGDSDDYDDQIIPFAENDYSTIFPAVHLGEKRQELCCAPSLADPRLGIIKGVPNSLQNTRPGTGQTSSS
jgi:hypothetical protein